LERLELEDKYRKRSFAVNFAMGLPITKALRQAGYTKVTIGLGTKLLADLEVQAEIEKAYELLRSQLMQSKESIIAQLDADREFAYNEASPSAAIAATVAKARILGLMNQNGEDKNMPKKVTIEWGDENKETIYEKSNPLVYDTLKETVGR
jgi:hypothetical protein